MISELVTIEAVGEGRFRGCFDASWSQGPGVFGGLVAAMIGRCTERVVPGRPVRSMALQLCAPLRPAPFEVEVVQERAGSFVSFVTVRVLQDAKPAALAQLTLGAPRQVDGDFDHSQAPSFPAVESLPDLGRPAGVPAFTQHFDLRFVEGVPFTGQQRARSAGWMRPSEPVVLDTAVQLALLDTWPLAVLPTFPGPRAAASVAIQFQLFPGVAAAGSWFQVVVEGQIQQGGYSEQTGRLWGPDGRLIGLSHQLVVRLR